MGECHVQRVFEQFCAQMVSHGHTDDLSRIQIHDGRQIEKALSRVNISDVRQPDFIGAMGCELSIQHIGDHKVIWI